MIYAANTSAIGLKDGVLRRYMPEMDGLRAFAVLAVMYQHWLEPRIPFGSWGVILFFVISGYLITGSIYTLRETGNSLTRSATIFFYHRALRLFPAYYVLLAIALVLLTPIRADILWYAVYVSNFLMIARQHYIALTATWSLCVEEQFYLIWFFLVMLLPTRRIPVLMIILVVLSLIYRTAMTYTTMNFTSLLLPGSVDALALGSLLCVAERANYRVSGWGIFLSTIGAIVSIAVWKIHTPSAIQQAIIPTIIALFSCTLVWVARKGFPLPVGFILRNWFVVYLGRISYGLYLYHMIAPDVVRAFLPSLNLGTRGWSYFTVSLVATITLASCSYHFLELPALRAKRLLTAERKSTLQAQNEGASSM